MTADTQEPPRPPRARVSGAHTPEADDEAADAGGGSGGKGSASDGAPARETTSTPAPTPSALPPADTRANERAAAPAHASTATALTGATGSKAASLFLSPFVGQLLPRRVPMHPRLDPFNVARGKVSGNRRRWQDGKYDLDLSYITPRMIAMAFPAEDVVGQFSVVIRNRLATVKMFLDERHGAHYRIFNLCAEKTYAHAKFDAKVTWIPCVDHHPPTLHQMKNFVFRVNKWLLLHPENVAAVHCKGGKGRTGMMICSWLMAQGLAPSNSAPTNSIDQGKYPPPPSLSQGIAPAVGCSRASAPAAPAYSSAADAGDTMHSGGRGGGGVDAISRSLFTAPSNKTAACAAATQERKRRPPKLVIVDGSAGTGEGGGGGGGGGGCAAPALLSVEDAIEMFAEKRTQVSV